MARPEELTVEQVVGREEWSGKNGQMVTYEMLFEGEGRTYKGHVPADQDPSPAPGGKVKGWKNDGGKFGFATDKPRSGGGGGRQGQLATNGDDPYARRPDHPAVEARAKHSTAIGAATDHIDQLLTIGAVAQPKDADEYWALWDRVVARLEASYPDHPAD
jgi:hypothetical protein